MDITAQLIEEFKFQPFQVINTLELFNQDATVPFIARYRKEKTGELNEIQIRDLLHRYTYFKELEERRTTILESIREQEKLTPELEAKINATLSKTELEDLYLPFKPKRKTRATKAIDAGLEPLAQWLLALEEVSADIVLKAAQFVNAEAGYDSAAKALAGASDIIAEQISDNAEIRKQLREVAETEGVIFSEVRKEWVDKKTKFDMYYNFREKVSSLPSHRILAMFRGEREDVLRLCLEMPRDAALPILEKELIAFPKSAAAGFLKATAADSFDRLLLSATETEIRFQLRECAEAEAFKVFGENLKALLLAPPAGRKPVMGVDPGFRSGCKVVCLDDTGKYLDYNPIYPHEPQKDTIKAAKVLLREIEKHNVALVAIGNGTASRETEAFVRETISTIPQERRPICVIVSESGASVYSASDVAIKEFPDFDITVRGAISIARRLQDPLSELVKIDPKAIGVGQYQHDVSQTKLKESLDEVVESCVNRVGVDVNLASEEVLKHISGLNKTLAANIVTFRNENGAFGSRDDLKKVPRFGEKAFEQAAGFLRIAGSNKLDNSSVHPERYEFVRQMATALKSTIEDIVGNTQFLRSIPKQQFVTDAIGLPTIEDIISELEKPGRDPREEFRYAKFSDTVHEIKDLTEGMQLEGTVSNVTNFGAFVDIGVHQDGLVHISELADRYVTDPRQVVSVGQIVKVRVLTIDKERKRIALSMKTGVALAAAPAFVAGPKAVNKPNGKAAPKNIDTRDTFEKLREKFGAVKRMK